MLTQVNWWTRWSAQVRPGISLGPLQFNFYGLIIGLSIWLAYQVSLKLSKQYSLPAKAVDQSLGWILLPALVFARAYHVVDFWDYYRQHPGLIVAIWQGGLGIWGGLVGAFLGLWWYCRQHNYQIVKFLHLVSPGVLLAQGIGRWGNFVNQEAFGGPTDWSVKIFISVEKRPEMWQGQAFFQPLFLYEFVWDVVFGLLLLYWARRKLNFPSFPWYLIFYGTGRLLVEQGRFDTATLWGFKLASILSLSAVVLGSVWLWRLRKAGK